LPQSQNAPAFALVAPTQGGSSSLVGIADALVPTDFNCFGLNVTGAGIPTDPTIAACSAPDSPAAGIISGLTPLTGGVVDVTVPIGTGRTIQLFVLQSRIGCPADAATIGRMLSGLDLGVPYEVARKINVDVAGDMTINLDARWNPLSPKKVFCSNGVGTPTSLAFTGPSSAITTACSAVSVSVLDGQGSLVSLRDDLSVTLGGAGGGAYFSDASCSVAQSANLTIAAGTNSKTVYYRGNTAGSKSLTVAGLGVGNQTLTVSIGVPPPVSLALTGSGTVSAGGCQAYTVTALDPVSVASNVLSATTAVVTSSSGNLTLYPSAGCASGGATSLNLSIAVASNSTTFYAGGSAVGSYSISVVDSASVLTGGSLSVSIATGTATQLAFTTQPSSTGVAGVSFASQPVVQVRDAFGNAVMSASNSIQLLAFTDASCISGASGSVGAASNPLSATSGVAAFASNSYTKSEVVYLQASSAGLASACSTAITVSAGAPNVSNSTLVASPSSGINSDGVSVATITVTLFDTYNNAVPGQSVTLSSTGSGNSLTQPASVTDAAGQTTGTLASTVAEAKTISITAPAGFGALSATTGFVSGTVVATFSSITGTGPVIANGSATSTITITLKDASNNPVSGVVPTFTATDTGSTNSYSGCSASNGSGISTCAFTSTRAEAKTLSISTPISLTGTSVTFDAGPATTFAVGAFSGGSLTAGVADTFNVTAMDAFGNTVTGYTGNVTFTSNDGQAVLPANYTFTGGDLGVKSFAATLKTSGTRSVTATDTGTSITGTLSGVSVVPGPANNVVYFTAPSTSGTTGVPFAIQPVVQVRDAYGNLPSVAVPITLGAFVDSGCTSASGSTLSATTNPLTSTSGLSSFGGVTFNGVGTIYLKASSSGLTPDCSTAIAVTSGAATQLAFAASPGSGTAGSTLASAVIELRDGGGNVDTSSTDVVTLAAYMDSGCTTPGGGTLSGTITQAAVAGSTSFSGLSYTSTGNLYLKATSGALISACTTAIPISAGAPTSLVLTGSGSVGVGFCETYTATQYDAFGNFGIGTATPITLSGAGSGAFYSDAGCTSATSTATITSGSGTGTFYFRSLVAQSLSLTVAELGGFSLPVTVNAGAPDHMILVSGDGQTGIVNSLLASPLIARVTDFAGNGIAGENIQYAVTTGIGTVGSGILVSDVNGESVNSYTLGTSSGAAEVITVGRNTTPLPGSPATVAFTETPTPDTADVPFSTITATGPVVADGTTTSAVTITLRDQFNNPVSSIIPTFSATGTGNAYGACSPSDTSGVSNCTLSSTVAEAKTLQIVSPVAVGGGSVTFTSAGGTATQLSFVTQPSASGTAATPLAVQPVVAAVDGAFAVDTGFTGAIHLSISPNSTCDVHAMEIDPLYATQSAVSGQATFTNIGARVPMTVYLLATAPGLAPACSNGIVISSSGPYTFDFWINDFAAVGDCTQAGIKVVDSVNNDVTVASAVTAGFTGLGGGQFYSDSACTSAISTVVLPAGPSTSVQAYFKNTTAGTLTLQAFDTGAVLQSVNRQHTVLNSAADPAKLDVSTTQAAFAANACGGPFTADLKKYDNSTVTAASSISIDLSGSGTPTFFTDPGCTAAVTSVSIGAAQSSVQFYLKQTQLGLHKLQLTNPIGEIAPNVSEYIIDTTSPAPVMLTFISAENKSAQINQCKSVPLVARNANYQPALVSAPISLTLSVVMGTGVTFYTDSTCTTPTTTSNFAPGSSFSEIFFKGTTQGEIILQATDVAATIIGAELHSWIDSGSSSSYPYYMVIERTQYGPIALNTCHQWTLKTYQGSASPYSVPSPVNFNVSVSPTISGRFYSDPGCTAGAVDSFSTSVPVSSNQAPAIYFKSTANEDVQVTVTTTEPSFKPTHYEYILAGTGLGTALAPTRLKVTGADLSGLMPSTDCRAFQVETTDNYERPSATGSGVTGITVNKPGSSGSADFYLLSGCTDTPQSSLSGLSIAPSTTSSGTFYLRASSPGGTIYMGTSGSGGLNSYNSTSICVKNSDGSGCSGGGGSPYYTQLDMAMPATVSSCQQVRLKSYNSSGGSPANIPTTTNFNLTVPGGLSGRFFTDAGCTTGSSTLATVTINSGTNNSNYVYFRATVPEDQTVTTTTSATTDFPASLTSYFLVGSGSGSPQAAVKISTQNNGNIIPNTGCEAVQIVSVDNWNRASNVGTAVTGINVVFSGSSVGGEFHLSPGCGDAATSITGYSIAASTSNGGTFYVKATTPSVQLNLNVSLSGGSGMNPGGSGFCVTATDGSGCGGSSYPNYANLQGPSNPIALSTCHQYNLEIRNNSGPLTLGANANFTLTIPGGTSGKLFTDAACGTAPQTSIVATVTSGSSNSGNFWLSGTANEDIPVTITNSESGFAPTSNVYWLMGTGSGSTGPATKLRVNGTNSAAQNMCYAYTVESTDNYGRVSNIGGSPANIDWTMTAGGGASGAFHTDPGCTANVGSAYANTIAASTSQTSTVYVKATTTSGNLNVNVNNSGGGSLGGTGVMISVTP